MKSGRKKTVNIVSDDIAWIDGHAYRNGKELSFEEALDHIMRPAMAHLALKLGLPLRDVRHFCGYD